MKADPPVYDTINLIRECLDDLVSKFDREIAPAVDVFTAVNLREEIVNTYIEINGYSAYLSNEQKVEVVDMLRRTTLQHIAEMSRITDILQTLISGLELPETPNAEEKQVRSKSSTRKKRTKKGSKKSGSKNKEPSSAS